MSADETGSGFERSVIDLQREWADHGESFAVIAIMALREHGIAPAMIAQFLDQLGHEALRAANLAYDCLDLGPLPDGTV